MDKWQTLVDRVINLSGFHNVRETSWLPKGPLISNSTRTCCTHSWTSFLPHLTQEETPELPQQQTTHRILSALRKHYTNRLYMLSRGLRADKTIHTIHHHSTPTAWHSALRITD
jgi:hypothetical protein